MLWLCGFVLYCFDGSHVADCVFRSHVVMLWSAGICKSNGANMCCVARDMGRGTGCGLNAPEFDIGTQMGDGVRSFGHGISIRASIGHSD